MRPRRALQSVMLCLSLQAHASGVVDIATDARFEPAVADAGMQHPAEFTARGIYMAAPVDAAKDVVLFVHGARGSPRDFAEMASELDPARQQAWFVYYASGDSIADSGHAIAVEVLAMMSQHGITRVSVLAHSMGGLVAWQAISELERQVSVERFVSVNTPWGGDPAAQLGAWFSPSPLPIWIDLAPGSKALTSIQQHRLRTPFTLVYTVRQASRESSGDGTVSLRSQTVPEVQRQAVSVVRETGTHMSVLHGHSAERLSLLLGASRPWAAVQLSRSAAAATP